MNRHGIIVCPATGYFCGPCASSSQCQHIPKKKTKMKQEFKVGADVWVLGKVTNVDGRDMLCVETSRGVSRWYSPEELRSSEATFLIEGRMYQCRVSNLTAMVNKNAFGWWTAEWSDGISGCVSEKGFVLTDGQSPRDLIALLPEPVICECCGQVVKEKV